MDLSLILSVAVVVVGAISSVFVLVPKIAKYKWIVKGGEAMALSLSSSRSAEDDTPGIITAAEYAEAFEAGANAVKKTLSGV